MPAATANCSSQAEVVTVLAVGCANQLRRILGHSRWTLLEAATVREALGHLHERAAVVVICEAALPDGTWRDLLNHTLRFPLPPPVIVAASHADDRLWMEVLNGGAYNLLGKPFEDRELFWMVSMAWRHRWDKARGGASEGAG